MVRPPVRDEAVVHRWKAHWELPSRAWPGHGDETAAAVSGAGDGGDAAGGRAKEERVAGGAQSLPAARS